MKKLRHECVIKKWRIDNQRQSMTINSKRVKCKSMNRDVEVIRYDLVRRAIYESLPVRQCALAQTAARNWIDRWSLNARLLPQIVLHDSR